MNLTSLLKSFIVVAVLVLSVSAQQGITEAEQTLNEVMNSREGKTELFMSFVVIDGKTFVAKTRHEYQVLSSMVDMVNVLKRVRAKKGINATQYSDKVAALFSHAESLGIKAN